MASPHQLFTCGYLFSILFFAATSVGAQTDSPLTCGLDARNRANVPLPTLDARQPFAADLNHAFDLVSLQHQIPEGERALRLVLKQASAAKNPCAEGLASFGLGQAARALHFSEALPHFLRAQELLQHIAPPLTLAYIHSSIATTRHALGDNDAFLQAVPQVAKELRDAGDLASAIGVESVALQYAGTGQKPDEQAALYKQLESVDAPNSLATRGFLQWEWGSALRRTGRYPEILAHMQAALADLIACDCEPSTRAAVLLTFAAAASGSGDPAVLRYATQADEIYRKDHFDSLRPNSLRLIAAAYAQQRDWPRALATYADALRLGREQSVAFSVFTIGLEYAAAYGDSGQPLKGLQILTETTPAETTPARSTPARPTPARLTPDQQCSLQTTRMVLESQAAQYPLALSDGQKVFAGCRDILQPGFLAVLSMRYADAQLRAGQTGDALTHAREAVALIDSQRPRVQAVDRAVAEFNEQQSSVYTVLIRALLQAGKPEEALLASEQDRARAFVDLAGTSQPTSPTAAGPAAPAQHGPRGPGSLKSEVHPFNLTAADIRSSLEKQHSTLISYWIGDDRLYTWVMAPGKPVIERDQPLNPALLAMLVSSTLPRSKLPGESSATTRGAQVHTRGGSSQGIARASRKPWADLYQLLIAPIAADLPTGDGSLLTIVPQGPLFQLSFPALLNPQNRYLIEHYALNTAPSAGMLEVTAKNEAASSALAPRYVVLANPERFPLVNGTALPPLPGTEAEARGIAHQLAGKQLTLLEGRDAGIDTLTGTLPQTTVLHLATHALVSDTAPGTSFLALDSRQQGGKLTASAVYGLHLHANLVVLSACSTGRGKISGDGVAGLSRAFFYAGAASLITTLWDVVDEPTSQLMPKFYNGLAQGQSRSAALRNAQLSLITNLRARRVRVETLSGTRVPLPESPAYWAAFSLSGQP